MIPDLMSEAVSQPRVVLHPVHPPGLADALHSPDDVDLLMPGRDELDVSLAGADGLVTYRWDDSFLDHRLRWVQAVSAGTDQFPLEKLADRGVVLTSARGAHTPAVADHAVTLLLALLRRLSPAMRRSVDHVWKTEMAHETQGITVGIVGLGSIGEAVARRVTGLGMTVIGCKRDPSHHDGVAERVVGPEEMEVVFADSDAVIVALPHTPDTEASIGRTQLEALGRGWLVNVGRGALVDEEALIEMIENGSLRGAALDVTATEPLPDDSPLWDLEDVIVTPHMAWGSNLLIHRLVEIITANMAALGGDGAWVNRVE